MYYKIGEVAKRLNVAPSTLRYYDEEGLLPFIERSASGVRLFKEADFEWLFVIDCLKKTGMPIKKIKTFLEWARQGDASIDMRLKMFQEQRSIVEAELARVQDLLDIMNYKCWYYETAKSAGTTSMPRSMKIEDMPEEVQPYKEKYLKKSLCASG